MKRFTSLVSILVCLAMILAMIPAVFAAEGDTFVKVTDVADLAAGDQIIIVSVDDDYALGTNQKSSNRGGTAITKDGDKVTATADVQVLTLEAGAVEGTFAFSTGEGYLYAASSSKNYLRTEETLSTNSSWSISITDGVASVVAQGENTRATMQYNPNNGVPLFACYASASQSAIAIYKLVEETGEETEPENPLPLGTNTLVSGVEYTYTVPADGRLEMDILTVKDSAGSTIYSYTFNQGTRVQVLVDGQPITLDAKRQNVTAGQKITVQVVSVDGDTYTVNMKLTEVEAAEELILGNNDIAQDLEYVYTAEQDGTLYVSIVELLYNDEQSTESSLGSSVLYQINGASVSTFEKSYEVKTGDETAVVIEDYSWDDSGTVSAVINLSYEGFFEHPAGSLNNPVDLLYADCPTQTIEIPAGSAVWYELESYYDNSAWATIYPFDDKDLVVTGEGAYVIVDGTRYDAVDGVVIVRMGYDTLIQIGNDGAEAAIFDLSVSIPEGHKDNPQDLVEGDNVVTLPSYGVHYYDFIATEDGTVTVTISGDNWRVYFYHYDAEGNELVHEDRYAKNGDSDTFTVEIKAGESIVLTMGTSQGWSQPGGELTVTFHFEPAECKHENMGEWTVYTEATCTEAGEERSYCANCDHYESRTIEAKGHEMGEWTVYTEATCTENGEERSYCAHCDHYESRAIEAKGHEMGEWTVYTEATCTEAGEERSYCAHCDHYEAREIAATGHSHEVTDSKDATCTENGHVTYSCGCGHTYTETIEATGHNYVDGVCQACGEADPSGNPATGSSIALALAVAMISGMGVVALTVKKKEF